MQEFIDQASLPTPTLADRKPFEAVMLKVACAMQDVRVGTCARPNMKKPGCWLTNAAQPQATAMFLLWRLLSMLICSDGVRRLGGRATHQTPPAVHLAHLLRCVGTRAHPQPCAQAVDATTTSSRVASRTAARRLDLGSTTRPGPTSAPEVRFRKKTCFLKFAHSGTSMRSRRHPYVYQRQGG